MVPRLLPPLSPPLRLPLLLWLLGYFFRRRFVCFTKPGASIYPKGSPPHSFMRIYKYPNAGKVNSNGHNVRTTFSSFIHQSALFTLKKHYFSPDFGETWDSSWVMMTIKSSSLLVCESRGLIKKQSFFEGIEMILTLWKSSRRGRDNEILWGEKIVKQCFSGQKITREYWYFREIWQTTIRSRCKLNLPLCQDSVVAWMGVWVLPSSGVAVSL